MKIRQLIAAFAALAVAAGASAAEPAFTYDDIEAGRFAARGVAGVRSMADGEHYTVLDSGRVVKYSYATGEKVAVLADPESVGVEAGRIAGYELDAGETRILFTVDRKPLYRHSAHSRYIIHDLKSGRSEDLVDSGEVRFALFSPDGSRVAYVLDNDIYIREVDGGGVTRVTDDGRANSIINGMPDWVYEEEWGMHDALRWSLDGRRLAFLRFDESRVKEYSLPMYMPAAGTGVGDLTEPLYPRMYTYKYPMPGEENSAVSLHVYDLRRGTLRTADTGGEADQYLPAFGFTPRGDLWFVRMNRLQNRLEMMVEEGSRHTPRTVYEETSDKYIDYLKPGDITFLEDGDRFVVRNETRSGYYHIYMYSLRRGFLYPLTEGEWEVQSIVAATDDAVWYLSKETSPMRNNLYAIGTDGRGKKRLSEGEGVYSIAPSRGCKYYISYFSSRETPPTITLHSGDGRMIRMLEYNGELKKYVLGIGGLPEKKFFTFPVEHEGSTVELNCYMIRPRDFDPGRSYPVLFTQYSGPGSQEVLDSWKVDWEDALVEQGYIVVCCDPRGTGGRGEWFKKLTYGQIGWFEAEDHIALARRLAELPWVDAGRIGIYGWSFGGFTSLNCMLRGDGVFSTAVSVAPVTSWRYYDSIYTERYNGLPQTNAEGYDRPSPIYYAGRLKGNLLLVTGSADDNVHPQNTFRMSSELVGQGKRFDMMVYTDCNHSMLPYGRWQVRHKLLEYCLENL